MGLVRRHLGLIVAAGALLALTVPAADAADGDPVVAGDTTSATGSTGVISTSYDGLVGGTQSSDSIFAGVYGYNRGAGSGVEGHSDQANGVQGLTEAAQGSGVYGQSLRGGYGVTGRTANGGVAVWANDSDGSGVALRTTGKIQFQQRSNTTTVASGQTTRTVLLSGITASSRILATVQRTGGYFVQAAVPAAGSFTIHLNKAAPAPQTVPVGYLVIN